MIKKQFSIIFGITADPIHKGHEQAIINGVEFCRDNGIEIVQFILIPVFKPNLIADKKPPIASFDQRFLMCELVANRLSEQLNCDIQVSQIEKELAENTGKKNYSFNTIRQLNIDKQLFMLSADHFCGRWPKFRKWYKWHEILQYCGLLINQRPGSRINRRFIAELRQINSDVLLVQKGNAVDVSSTEIRQGFDANQAAGWLASDVIGYIKEQGLY